MEKKYSVEEVSQLVNNSIANNYMIVVRHKGHVMTYAILVFNKILQLVDIKVGNTNLGDKMSKENLDLVESDFEFNYHLIQDVKGITHIGDHISAYKDYVNLIELLEHVDRNTLMGSLGYINPSSNYIYNYDATFGVPAEIAGLIVDILLKKGCKTVSYSKSSEITICKAYSSLHLLKCLANNIENVKSINQLAEKLVDAEDKMIIFPTDEYGVKASNMMYDYMPFIDYKPKNSVDASIRVYQTLFDDFQDENFEDCINHCLKNNKVLKTAIVLIPTVWLSGNLAEMDKNVNDLNSMRNTMMRLYKGRHIESIIELPSEIDGISHSLLILNTKGGSEKIRFINATECLVNDLKGLIADTGQVMDNYLSELSETDIMKDYVYKDVDSDTIPLAPHTWVPIRHNGEVRHTISDLISIYQPVQVEILNEEDDNYEVINPNNVLSFRDCSGSYYDIIIDSTKQIHRVDTLVKTHDYEQYLKAADTYKDYKVGKLEPKTIVLGERMTSSIAYYNGPEAGYISSGIAFHANLELITPEYLIYVLWNLDIPYSMYNNDSRDLLFSLPVVIPQSRKDQRAIVDSELSTEYGRRLEALAADQERFNIRSAAADIQHMLGTPFSQQKACMELIKRSKDEVSYKKHVKALIEISEYIQRVVTSVGADISSAEFTKVDINLPDILGQYVASYDYYSKRLFKLSFVGALEDKGFACVDVDMLKLQMDTILDNAGRHGFCRESGTGNLVQIQLDYYMYKGLPYYRISVMNNGKPKNPDYSIQDFISRGKFDGESGRTGLGGYHIFQIAKKHDGFVGIDSNSEWGFIVNVLIPVQQGQEIDKVKFISDGTEYV